MSQSNQRNQAWLLASRPHGEPVKENFRLVEQPIPDVKDGQILLRTLYLSLDPYMRGRMDDSKSYAAPAELDQPMVGGTVSEVVESKHADFQQGDVVLAQSGWQSYAVSDGNGVAKLGDLPHPSWALGILGMPGFTAYMGLMDIGQPKQGETLVVAAATGPVGATVGQLGKLKGCHVVGVAGGEEKCRYAIEKLGFSACIDHHRDDFAEQLAAACPDGIDIYFENVGGKVFDAVFPLLNTAARVPVCGLVSGYSSRELPPGPDRTPQIMGGILKRRIRMQGFIIFQDYGDRYPEFLKAMTPLVEQQKIHYREHMIDGLENAPQAFFDMLKGKNFGKTVVKVAQ
ncbi:MULTISPECIES: NADP-dependent oxidoreductase [Pantoea]|jgi:NADPH-dependent curcumin reductase CurA|uniref:NADP-dependent oxidoreductase n=1 Tax=Pantoea TaxID=53335 RepID=UPI00177F44BD|nr:MULTISPECIES: NADP-dependent oxidoreductase [Pantoea]MBD9643071.1 NADP-dependent oxidoreductase [Pantoea sp. PNT02]MDR6350467.1 NADPH-dependent curcumin reductase CurA [Pantoea sp. SORGH_AS_0659]WFL69260.1 NADP-dependent oxidoreductase [Pantoea sp. X85]WGK59018.1 NADP-dependent oxidoreductase [Pantoea sp. SS70]